MRNLSETQLHRIVTGSVIEVFKVMVAFNLEEVDPSVSVDLKGERVVGSVGFVGTITGTLYIHMTKEFARQITSAMLKRKRVDDGGEVDDAIGEMSSMIGGKLKSHMAGAGVACVLSAPSIVRGGEDLRVGAGGSMEMGRCVFRCRGHNALVLVNVSVAEGEPVAVTYPRHPKKILVRTITRGFEDGILSGVATTAEVSLSDKLNDYILRLGHSSVHLTGIIVELMTKGKVQVDFSEHTERMELVSQPDRLNSVQAMSLLEDYLVEVMPLSDSKKKSVRATQRIALPLSKPVRKHG